MDLPGPFAARVGPYEFPGRLGRREQADGLGELFSSCDVLAMPTVPIVAPPRDDFAAHLMTLSRNAIPWSFVGFPALSLPCGEVGGLPVGLQLVAAPYREDLLVALGSALEGALWAVS